MTINLIDSLLRNPRIKSYYADLAILVCSLLFAQAVIGQELVSLFRQDQKSVSINTYSPIKDSCRGVAIISPGAGGSEKGYAYLARSMAAQGYLAIVVGHQESGQQALRQQIRNNGLRKGLSQLITDPQVYRSRFMDIHAAKHWAEAHCNAHEFILLGHSMGAATVMLEAGAKNKLGVAGTNAFDVYVALSPQGIGLIFPPDAWTEITKPVLSITGTRDNEELSSGTWKTRSEPFNNMPVGCKWFGIIDDASHMNFAGIGMSQQTEALTVQTIQAFLLRIHQHDCKSRPQIRGIEVQVK